MDKPVSRPQKADDLNYMRYSRQIKIDQIGIEGQKKLANASVFVAGAGGLGSPVLTYLALAGIGRLGFIDSDTVDLSNLNRQFLHHNNDIGKFKSESAEEKLSSLNSEIDIIPYTGLLTDKNAETIFKGYDLILGAVDSFETRFVINRACIFLGIPYIDGGINGFSGCIMFSFPPKTPCFACIFPEKAEKKKSVGVIGTTAGFIGTMEANIAILHLLELQNPAENRLLLYDGLRMNIDHIEIKRNDICPVCAESFAAKCG